MASWHSRQLQPAHPKEICNTSKTFPHFCRHWNEAHSHYHLNTEVCVSWDLLCTLVAACETVEFVQPSELGDGMIFRYLYPLGETRLLIENLGPKLGSCANAPIPCTAARWPFFIRFFQLTARPTLAVKLELLSMTLAPFIDTLFENILHPRIGLESPSWSLSGGSLCIWFVYNRAVNVSPRRLGSIHTYALFWELEHSRRTVETAWFDSRLFGFS